MNSSSRCRRRGVFHSDLSGRDGLYPFSLPGVLGHEGVGSVRSIGSAVTTVAVDDRVVMNQALRRVCVERVVMEATSDYWKPVFYLLEAHGLDPWLVNARDAQTPAR